jgi:hypothetical protein
MVRESAVATMSEREARMHALRPNRRARTPRGSGGNSLSYWLNSRFKYLGATAIDMPLKCYTSPYVLRNAIYEERRAPRERSANVSAPRPG